MANIEIMVEMTDEIMWPMKSMASITPTQCNGSSANYRNYPSLVKSPKP